MENLSTKRHARNDPTLKGRYGRDVGDLLKPPYRVMCNPGADATC